MVTQTTTERMAPRHYVRDGHQLPRCLVKEATTRHRGKVIVKKNLSAADSSEAAGICRLITTL